MLEELVECNVLYIPMESSDQVKSEKIRNSTESPRNEYLVNSSGKFIETHVKPFYSHI